MTGFSNLEDTLDGSKALLPFLLEDELKRAGGRYARNWIPFTSRVETDGLLITGQNPQPARAVGSMLVTLIGKSAPTDSPAQGAQTTAPQIRHGSSSEKRHLARVRWSGSYIGTGAARD